MAGMSIRKNPPNIFGRAHLGYIVIETRKFAEWARFGRDIIGLHVDEIDATTMKFRLDDHECRFLLRYGPAEDVVAVGWEMDDHAAFDEVLTRVTERGVPVAEGSGEDAALRGVERLWRIPGPRGVVQEIYTTPHVSDTPLRMITAGGYVTGESGMGHVAFYSREPAAMRGYYNTVFDARLSDYIEASMGPGMELFVRFLRVNERHHSVAIAAPAKIKKLDPIRTSIQHLNIQATTLEDMVGAYERVVEAGVNIAMPVGQHSNDRELSFYAITPSGFEWEVGWNPLLFTPEVEDTWEVNNYRGISSWGHTPMGMGIVDKMNAFKTIVKNLRTQEPVVAELKDSIAPEGKEREFQLGTR